MARSQHFLSDHFTTTKFSTVEQKAALANLLVHGALSTSDLAIQDLFIR